MLRFALLALPLTIAACDGGETTDDTATAGLSEAELLAELEADLASYDTWDQATGVEGVVATPGGMHGEHVQIWYDPTALANLDGAADGSKSFKEGYPDAEGATLEAVTAMRYDADFGWFYAMWNGTGELQSSGRIEMCIGCHEATDPGGYLAP